MFANVGQREDVCDAIKNGADSIGLYRIESIYLGRQEPADYACLLKEIRKTLAPARGLPVYVRLLDIGADKPFPFKKKQRESNPSLGRRGIRFLHEYPDSCKLSWTYCCNSPRILISMCWCRWLR